MYSINPILKIDKINNISAYDYYKFYIRNSRFLGIIWQCLTICFGVCILIAFVSPNWIGDTLKSSNRGYFGLYTFCTRNSLSTSFNCFGTWTDLSTLPNSIALKLSCLLVGISVLLIFLCLFISIFSVVIKYERVFHICAWIQLLTTICLLIGVCIYPISWDLRIIRSVCGEEASQFKLATCTVRWPYILACLATGQIFLLTVLAFLLAARQAKFILIYGSSNNTIDYINNYRSSERTFFA